MGERVSGATLLLLASGFTRAALWLAAMCWAIHLRRAVATAGFALCVGTSVVFTFRNANLLPMDHWLSETAVQLATPAAALVAAAFILTPIHHAKSKRWRL